MENKKVLTFNEALAYTGYRRSYFYKLTHAGVIPHSKPNGKAIFFDREKLEEWLLSNPRTSLKDRQQSAANYVTTS